MEDLGLETPNDSLQSVMGDIRLNDQSDAEDDGYKIDWTLLV